MDYLIVHGNLFELTYRDLVTRIRQSGFPSVVVIEPFEMNLRGWFRNGQPKVVQFEGSSHSLTLYDEFRKINGNPHYFMWLQIEGSDLEQRATNAGMSVVKGDELILLDYISRISRK